MFNNYHGKSSNYLISGKNASALIRPPQCSTVNDKIKRASGVDARVLKNEQELALEGENVYGHARE